MANKQKILIVDDDENIANLISLYLTKECYETRIEHDGQSALDAFKEYAPNLILLDIMLPGLDGYEVCREIRRESKVPIIMLSAKTEVFDKVLGLELGADDYIIKPFDSKDLIINLSNYEVIYKGKPVEMTPREIELLYFLASSPNQVFTREQLLDHIWGYEYAGDTRTVDVHIKRIREKIADTDQWSIGTVWSVGYRFEVHN